MNAQSHPAGLTGQEAAARLQRDGPNSLPEQAPEPVWWRFLRQFKSPLIYILLFALAVDLSVWVKEGAHGLPFESIVIGLILLLNAGLGVWQESKAEAALAKLKSLSVPQAWTLRDGEWHQVPASLLVQGDVVRVESGDRIPADGVALGHGLALDESILTGESMPVDKSAQDELFSGTLVTRGTGHFEVSRTGSRSALGRLAGMLGGVEAETTPLERRLDRFGHQIAKWVLGLAFLLVVIGLVTQGMEHFGDVFLFAVALAVAAVPEGLPAVLTLTLALGVERMARRKAVVRKLSAVEALGSVTVIATDKTGTLTENRMQVRRLESTSGEAAKAIVLANDAESGAGDPVDVALLEYAQAQGVNADEIRRTHPRLSDRSFDSGYKYMRATVSENGRAVSYLKGAPEVLLERSRLTQAERAGWLSRVEDYAADGFRVLGLARGPGEREDDLEFLGAALFWDPPRNEVPAAIRAARQAGIRVLMVTGDHPATAGAVSSQIGIESDRVATGDSLETGEEANVYARVQPEHKLRLVEILQKRGEIVAMTGDGVNDAPALKRSDVGVAMGQRGSAVSREVADLVLLDDNFATIVAAIEEGRGIYENIQKFIRFLFSTNLSEVIVVGLGMVLAAVMGLRDSSGGLLLPLTAVQILWINLVTDGLPALALALDRNPGVIERPPRPPDSPLLDRLSIRFVVSSGMVKAAFALAILATAQFALLPVEAARTATFHFMSIGQLFFVYPARHTELQPSPNPVLHLAVAGGVLLQIVVGSLPMTQQALGLVPLAMTTWLALLAAALTAWGIAELINRLVWGGVVWRGVTPRAPRS